mmetsp:Transcript_60679/g.131697  ORF Transcript_60679/g.131697 Transcript_60679/m.131697 type:complete len:499 (+) Transcript_60679:578-2074(+)
MLPLDTITAKGGPDASVLKPWLDNLKAAGTTGITVDVWWGLIETAPQTYDWSHYDTLFSMIQTAGLKAQPIMDFHRCGGNVGDDCDVPLPSWVLSVGQSNPDIFYIDNEGNVDHEYISLFVDELALFPDANGPNARTPVQLYHDFIASFVAQYSSYLGSNIEKIEIGMGPAGEMRYPGYQAKFGWKYCGVGAFQSYNTYAVSSISAAATAAGNPQWGQAGGPDNAGKTYYYIDKSSTPFFVSGEPNNYESGYGRFYLNWYFDSLLAHGRRVLGVAQQAIGNKAQLMGKVAGIHWWYKNPSHAAELTAGYYNTNGVNAYAVIAKLFSDFDAAFDFTAMGLADSSQPADCQCGPQQLVTQTKQAALQYSVPYGGENALPLYGSYGYGLCEQAASELNAPLDFFSYLRLDATLMTSTNLAAFTSFVSTMSNLALSSSGNDYNADSTGTTTTDHTHQRTPSWAVGLAASAVVVVVVAAVVVVIRRRQRNQEAALEPIRLQDL